MLASNDMRISEILNLDGKDNGIEEIFLENGMHCTHCPVARAETLIEACSSHGVDHEAILNKINNYLGSKQ